jgi:hypothetical protein
LHQVLEGASSAVLSRIQDLIHLIFFLVFDQIRRRSFKVGAM